MFYTLFISLDCQEESAYCKGSKEEAFKIKTKSDQSPDARMVKCSSTKYSNMIEYGDQFAHLSSQCNPRRSTSMD